ncbi:MAG: GNAT family N-acetyltransferase [Acidobacteria bacterium]|nr:MAG: GNAT family N-acetyltransferase [Acidobacteriota bacterium]
MRGRRCVVRPWRSSDASAVAKHANNANVARNLRDRFPHPYTASDAIGFSPGSDVERYSAEIGYWLAEPFWGRGIAVEALELVTAYAFDECNLLRLFALPFADNDRSTRVLEKAGFAREGLLRASAVKYGEPRDQALYARINPRWKGAM